MKACHLPRADLFLFQSNIRLIHHDKVVVSPFSTISFSACVDNVFLLKHNRHGRSLSWSFSMPESMEWIPGECFG
jgi:hypothetical protein